MLFSLLQTKFLDIINRLPGEQFPPHLFPGMEEWQIEYAIDYYLHNDQDESENTYFFMLKLTDDNGHLRITFSLEHFVQGVGATEIANFPLEHTEGWLSLLTQTAKQHDLHNDAVPAGTLFIEAIIPFVEQLRSVA